MPEYWESWLVQLLIKKFLAEMHKTKGPAGSVTLRNIWIDATDEEASTLFREGSLPQQGFVYKVGSTCSAKRGPSQQPIYPPMFANDMHQTIRDRKLKLEGVEFAARNVILHFSEIWCQVQLFTHTNAQIYTKSQWKDVICKVSKTDRGFKVAFALEFNQWVIAFLSLDNLISTHWAHTRAGLPASPDDVYDDFGKFLTTVAGWLSHRYPKVHLSSASPMLAMEVVRKASMPDTPHQRIFGGAGVYTVNEMFHAAGLSPDLTEYGLIQDGSRMARLCLAYLQVSIAARKDVWKLVKPCLRGWLIATTLSHRLRFKDYLSVFGKDITWMSNRQATLLDLPSTHVRKDMYEPLIMDVLRHEKNNLGHVIFGSECWIQLATEAGIPMSPATDALSLFYKPILTDVFPAPKSLVSGFYTDNGGLFAGNLKETSRRTHLYRAKGSDKRDMWSVVGLPPSEDIAEMDSTTRETRLLSTRINSSAVFTVGPLDFCGVAELISSQGKGKAMVAICHKDPTVEDFYNVKRERSRAVTINGLRDQPGVYRAISTLPLAKRKLVPEAHRKDSEDISIDGSITGPAKRKRMSVDAHLVLGSQAIQQASRTSRSRKT